MGSGSYSTERSFTRTAERKSVSREEIFTQRKITNMMDPKNTVRECCDSEEHPNTVPIIIGLDVTGSMGHVPDAFIREEMTKMMAGLYAAGLTSSQVLFMGIGDHQCDSAPLQVGQFEADDQLLDKWLKDIYLEGGGGGNDGESYLLAWFYGARCTKIDSFEKRGTKGFLFTIGDEHNLRSLSVRSQKAIFGENGVYNDISSDQLLKEVFEKYNVFHLNLSETRSGARPVVIDQWKQDMQENAINLDSYSEIADKIIGIVKGAASGSELIRSEPKPETTEEAML